MWMPETTFGEPGFGVRTGHNWRVIGLLKAGTSIEQANANISAIERQIKRDYPSPFQGKDASVVSLSSHIAGEVRRPERSLPIALIGGLFIVGVLFMATNAAIQYILPAAQIAASERPAVAALSVVAGPGGAAFVAAAMALTLILATWPK